MFLFVISMFGNLSVLRFLRIFRSRALISANVLTKIGTFAFTMMNLAIFFCANDMRTSLIVLVSANIAIFFALKWLERRQIDGLKNEIPEFIDRWILNMKLGSAVNTARDAALGDLDSRNRALLQPLFAASSDHHQNHPILDAKVVHELLLSAQHSHSALSRLENLRQMMRKSEKFRRKSGQAVRQTAIQSSVLLILLVCLAIFTIQTRGWHENSDFIIISLLISVVGLAVMRRIARKTRWKI